MTKIACFGDSLTKGSFDPEGGWPMRLDRYLRGIYVDEFGGTKHPVFNLGMDGDTTVDILKRIENEITARSKFGKPLTLIQIGANDSSKRKGKILVPGEDYASNLRKILELARPISKDVLLLGLSPCIDEKMNPSPWGNGEVSFSNKSLIAYDTVAKKIASEMEVDFVDIMAAFKDKDLTLFTYDGLHLNQVGQQYVADQVKKWVAEKANDFASA